jgi:hypothetical protein
MDLAQPRLRLALGGAVAALVAGGLIALAMIRGQPASNAPPPASRGGLVIDASGAQVGRIDPAKPLRCFVGGKFVGDLTLTDCAKRNGVATDALGVGVDASGALDAGQAVRAAAQPQPVATAPPAASAPAQPAAAPVADCWRYADSHWRKLPSQTTLNGCAQALFAGRCEPQGGASYGRWGEQTLRLVPGRVEISPDNRSFHTWSEQGAGCSIPGAAG